MIRPDPTKQTLRNRFGENSKLGSCVFRSRHRDDEENKRTEREIERVRGMTEQASVRESSVRVRLQREEDRERRRRRRITMEESIEYVHVTEKHNKKDSKLCNDILNSSSLCFPVKVQRIERQRRKVPWTKQRHKEMSFESKLSLFCIIGFEILLLDLVLFCVKVFETRKPDF